MSDKVVTTGTYVLQSEVNSDVIVSYDLAKLFSTISGVNEHNKIKRKLVTGDGTVTLDKGGVGTVKGFLIAVTEKGSGDSITLKHNGNVNGIKVTDGMLLHGEIDAVTVETAATSALTIEYLFFE